MSTHQINEEIAPADVTKVQCRDKIFSLFTPTRSLQLCARMNREMEVLDFIDTIPPQSILFDLGACEGRFSLYAALSGVQCYAFEPEQENFQTLMSNIALNEESLNNALIPLQLAVGSHNHESELSIGQPWAGGHHKIVADSSKRIDLNIDVQTSQKIHVISLDEYISANNLPCPNYLKVDVDGSELEFIIGATATLQSNELQKIIFELFENDKNYPEIVTRLKQCGWQEVSRFEVEANLYNIVYERS